MCGQMTAPAPLTARRPRPSRRPARSSPRASSDSDRTAQQNRLPERRSLPPRLTRRSSGPVADPLAGSSRLRAIYCLSLEDGDTRTRSRKVFVAKYCCHSYVSHDRSRLLRTGFIQSWKEEGWHFYISGRFETQDLRILPHQARRRGNGCIPSVVFRTSQLQCSPT